MQRCDFGDEAEPEAAAATAAVRPRCRIEPLERALERVGGHARATVTNRDVPLSLAAFDRQVDPAAGLTRSLMAFLIDAYTEDEAPNTKGGVDKRVVLKLDPRLAPVKAAVLPLSRNADLSPKAKDLAQELRSHGWNIDFDDSGAIGRRYRRQDEIGTPYCVTVDFDTLEDQAVTVRERDSMAQERVGLDQISAYFAQRFVGC